MLHDASLSQTMPVVSQSTELVQLALSMVAILLCLPPLPLASRFVLNRDFSPLTCDAVHCRALGMNCTLSTPSAQSESAALPRHSTPAVSGARFCAPAAQPALLF